MKKGCIGGSIFYLVVILLLIVGEVKCAFKAIDSDWNPIGKREVVYTVSFFTGIGGVIGYLDIPDEPAKPVEYKIVK